MEFKYIVEEGSFAKAGYASSEIKKILKQLNLPSKIVRKVVISVFEAEVNIVAHAIDGEIILKLEQNLITVVVKDRGPGIEDIDKAMKEGYSTASPKVREMGFGAGMGLPNIKKNCDRLNIDTELNVGTTLTIEIDF
ncbi:MAG: anti-sigma regulatory factor [Candidatus Cloacimonadota bacterium]|nr:MAG: anti-sigma regulatory factor [Candidatus Cloacimonadota bacterium]PIE79105.1 MAG: anti-sigma regulatory factor [Candidatus Delongbacteria bacterium]